MAHPYAAQAKSGNRSKVKNMTGKSISGNLYDGESTKAAGERTPKRLDNYARGGTVVNIIQKPSGASGSSPLAGALPPPPPALSPPPGLGGGAPPMPPPGPGGPPPMATGGRLRKLGMTAGAESGEGRLQKAKKYGLKPK